MTSSNCCFLTCIQISEEAGQMVCYSHLFQNSPHFIVILIVKGFDIVNEPEVDVFLEPSCWLNDPADVGNFISAFLPFLKPAWKSGSSRFVYCWSLAWRILGITLLAYEMSALCSSLNILLHCLFLGLEWKLTFSSLVTTAEFSKFVGMFEYSTFTAPSFRIWNSSTVIPSPLVLFIVMLLKAHLTCIPGYLALVEWSHQHGY